MDDKTKTMMLTLAAGVIKKGLITLGATAATHGFIASNQTETFVAIGMTLVGLGWSFWNDYGKAIVLSKLEVLKAKSLAQAASMKNAGVPPVTINQIAAQSQTMGPAEVEKVVATLPAAIQNNVKAGLVAVLLIGGLVASLGDAKAQGGIKVRVPDALKFNQAAAVPAPAPKPAAATGDPLSKFISDLEAIKQEVVDGIVADFNAADADAGLVLNTADPTSFKDPISHACYPAAVKFLQSLPVATPTTGKFILVQLFQKKRDFVAQIRAGLPVYLKLGCAPLIGDEAMIFAKLMGLIGVKVGLDALVPGLGFALPTL